jgi:hypothetical protein
MYQYPKLLFLVLSFVAAYVLFALGFFDAMYRIFDGYGYLSIFIGGLLFSFGFTSAFGVGIFVAAAPHVNPLVASVIGAVGAFWADYLIFSMMRGSLFHDELRRFTMTSLFRRAKRAMFPLSLSVRLRHYMMWSFAGIFIASPLPDEFGVMLIGGLSHMKTREFAFISMMLNAIGIFAILLAATIVS